MMASPAAAAPPANLVYLINGLSGKCLGINSGSHAIGALAMQWQCANQPFSDQGWWLFQIGSVPNAYEIHNQNSFLCLGIDRASVANGALAIQAACSGQTYNNQTWLEEPLGGGRVQFRNYNSGRCLGISAGSNANGALAMQWDCANRAYSDQAWIYDPV
ncbi:RICIN domain-containing protein [Nonomuraea sp. PA05]|uniref:RICIN domain-containing protein n=1 Tax=Nonomuraea sp. PA05 TaxID=2604466 RepID=UPI0016521798|nr:RICIN domain-containing protein [Nonomuraea sp. PA05]